MITKLTIGLESKEKIGTNRSSLMQGVLMELIDEDFADKLHQSGLHPYTQHLVFEDDNVYWVICTLNEEAKREIIDELIKDEFSEFVFKHNEQRVMAISKLVESTKYDELISNTYFGDCSPYINVTFKTPTAFKVDGRYQNYPTANNILRSLIKKYDNAAPNSVIYSEELLKEIDEYVEITNYRLRSTYFHLEGTRIPSFLGDITIHVRGPKPFVNLINMLFQFGEYSGVGIKTGIGMGAIEIKKRKERTIG